VEPRSSEIYGPSLKHILRGSGLSIKRHSHSDYCAFARITGDLKLATDAIRSFAHAGKAVVLPVRRLWLTETMSIVRDI
jgi:hypothetical protein